MNTMKMPGFSAEASLYKSGEFYQSARTCSALPGRQGVLPQLECTPFCEHYCRRLPGKPGGLWRTCVARTATSTRFGATRFLFCRSPTSLPLRSSSGSGLTPCCWPLLTYPVKRDSFSTVPLIFIEPPPSAYRDSQLPPSVKRQFDCRAVAANRGSDSDHPAPRE